MPFTGNRKWHVSPPDHAAWKSLPIGSSLTLPLNHWKCLAIVYMCRWCRALRCGRRVQKKSDTPWIEAAPCSMLHQDGLWREDGSSHLRSHWIRDERWEMRGRSWMMNGPTSSWALDWRQSEAQFRAKTPTIVPSSCSSSRIEYRSSVQSPPFLIVWHDRFITCLHPHPTVNCDQGDSYSIST